MKKIFLVICGLAICFICYLVFSKHLVNNEKQNEPIKKFTNEIKEEYDSEKFYFENLSEHGYGFIKVYNEDSIDIVELIKNGENKKIMSFLNTDEKIWHEPFHMLISNNNFYVEITYAEKNNEERFTNNKKYRMYKIDLNTLEVSKLYESTTYDLIYDEYAVYNNYVFRPRRMDEKYRDDYKIFRYDTQKDEEIVINDTLEIDDLFTCNDKLYLRNDIFYVMNIDGYNLLEISEEEYNKANKRCYYDLEKLSSDEDTHFVYKNKNVYIKDNKLMYGNDVLFTNKDNSLIELKYTNRYGYVGLHKYRVDDLSDIDLGYYIVNIDTKEVSEVDGSGVNDFYQVLYY